MSETLCYSFHAARRCLERGITERNVTETVRFGVCVECKDGRSVYARGRMRVVLSDEAMVITAFRMRRHNPKRVMREKRKRLRREWRIVRGVR